MLPGVPIELLQHVHNTLFNTKMLFRHPIIISFQSSEVVWKADCRFSADLTAVHHLQWHVCFKRVCKCVFKPIIYPPNKPVAHVPPLENADSLLELSIKKKSSAGYVKVTEKRGDVGKAGHISLQNQSAVVLESIISAFISKFYPFKLPYLFHVRR